MSSASRQQPTLVIRTLRACPRYDVVCTTGLDVYRPGFCAPSFRRLQAQVRQGLPDPLPVAVGQFPNAATRHFLVRCARHP